MRDDEREEFLRRVIMTECLQDMGKKASVHVCGEVEQDG